MRAHNQLAAILNRPMVKGIPQKWRLLWDRIDTSFTAPQTQNNREMSVMSRVEVLPYHPCPLIV